MKHYELIPVLVETITKDIEQGKLYISRKYACSIHLCACGCGEQTVLPFFESPEPSNGEWKMTDNNGQITFEPSIGNFSGENPYHAHYFIRDNKIVWC